MTLGKGRATAITDQDIGDLANELNVPPAHLDALAQVESNGFGWFDDGRIKILFEKHWFYKLLSGAKRTQAVNAGLARAKWISPANGGYKDQNTADQRYAILAKAIAIDETAALQSISMGRFQIMGFNWKICGFTSPQEMWARFLDDEENQLDALAAFLANKKLIPALRDGDWQKIETGYNGGGLNGVYAERMADAAKKAAAKWAKFKPNRPLIVDLPDEVDDNQPPIIVPDEEPRTVAFGVVGWAIVAILIIAAVIYVITRPVIGD